MIYIYVLLYTCISDPRVHGRVDKSILIITCCFLAEYDSLSRLGISDPKGFIKKRFKSEPLTYLSTCCAGVGIKDQIEASIEDALQANSWVDVSVQYTLVV